nr:immunoglobulin heavy chain junction region [Mus musculus]
CARDAMDFW